MKRIILNLEIKTNNFMELVQEAFNKNILNFLVSEETFSEFDNIERVNLYSKDPQIPSQFLIYEHIANINEVKNEKNSIKRNIGFFLELKSKEDEKKIIEISKTGYVDFIVVSAKDWKIIPYENLIAEMHSNDTDLIAEVENVK
ncbi:MAG TPA: hypothetical protein ENH75_04850, partial [archaeon]|nr:hypothetical protein [archaeon]